MTVLASNSKYEIWKSVSWFGNLNITVVLIWSGLFKMCWILLDLSPEIRILSTSGLQLCGYASNSVAKRSAKKVSLTLWFRLLKYRCTKVCFVWFYRSELCIECVFELWISSLETNKWNKIQKKKRDHSGTAFRFRDHLWLKNLTVQARSSLSLMHRKVPRVNNQESCGWGSGIPLLGNLSLDWEFPQRLGKKLGNWGI